MAIGIVITNVKIKYDCIIDMIVIQISIQTLSNKSIRASLSSRGRVKPWNYLLLITQFWFNGYIFCYYQCKSHIALVITCLKHNSIDWKGCHGCQRSRLPQKWLPVATNDPNVLGEVTETCKHSWPERIFFKRSF